MHFWWQSFPFCGLFLSIAGERTNNLIFVLYNKYMGEARHFKIFSHATYKKSISLYTSSCNFILKI